MFLLIYIWFFSAFTGGVYVHKVSHQLMKMRFTPCLLLSDYLKILLFFIQYPRDRPSLDPAAVPSLFDGAPSYLSTHKTPKRTSPRKRQRLTLEHEENKQEKWLDNDNITDYQQLTTTLDNRLRTEFPTIDLIVRHCGAHSLIYKLSDCEVIERNPSIYFTIRILKDLSIKLYINGILIHVSQLHWIIGHTNNALSCWTQLFEIIKRYNVAPVPDIMSKSAFLADTIKSL